MTISILCKKSIFCFACLIILLFAANVYAALPAYVRGKVFDSTTKEGIGNVPITLAGSSSSSISQPDGSYLILSSPGSFEIKATASGYDTFTDQVTLNGGSVIVLNIEMVPITNRPPTPEIITYPQKSYGNFTVSWSLVNEASAYILERAKNENFFDADEVYNGTQNSFIDGGLENGIYFYRVCSENNRVRSVWRTGPVIFYGDYVHKAVIIAGWNTEDDPLWEITKDHCDLAYRTLLLRLFDEKNITYLTRDAANNNRSGDTTRENIQSAIADAQDADELFIYMHDHGAREKFYLDGTSNIFLTPSELDGWMDGIQPETGGGPKIVLVIEACYSGSLIDDLTSAGSQERIIITSTSTDQLALFSPTGLTSFSSFFWSCVQSSQTILSAFNNTTQELYDKQTPQLDSDGDGIPNEDPDDGDLVADLYAGFQGITGAIRPIVSKVSVKPRNVLNGQTSAIIEAEPVFGPNEIDKVWAVIYPPGFSPDDLFSAVINIPTIELIKNGSKYEGRYDDFLDQGTYTITVIALDIAGFRSDPNTILAHQRSALQRSITVVPIFDLLLSNE